MRMHPQQAAARLAPSVRSKSPSEGMVQECCLAAGRDLLRLLAMDTLHQHGKASSLQMKGQAAHVLAVIAHINRGLSADVKVQCHCFSVWTKQQEPRQQASQDMYAV